MQIIFAFILFICLSPILVLVAIIQLILLFESPFFFQNRIGLHKNTFLLYKIKTMKGGRVTLFGKVLRKTGIDEIPQLINILKGEMNFVGPRPLMQSDIERLGWNYNKFDIRWSVKPGITGLAQLVNVCDKDVSFKNDVNYIENKSTSLDIKILWQSILIPFIGKSKTKQLIHK